MPSMRLATRPSRRAAMMGMPPATAASKAMVTWCLAARANSSSPCSASSALLAVTTCLPAFRQATHRSLAAVVPPTRWMTVRISGSFSRTSTRSVTVAPAGWWPRSRPGVRVTMVLRCRSSPQRSRNNAASRARMSTTPPPTVPQPIRPNAQRSMTSAPGPRVIPGWAHGGASEGEARRPAMEITAPPVIQHAGQGRRRPWPACWMTGGAVISIAGRLASPSDAPPCAHPGITRGPGADVMERCALGLIGWGTVGGGVVDILARDAALFRERCGLDLHLKTIVTRTPGRDRGHQPAGATVTDRVDVLLNDPEIRTVIHLVGGTTAAKDLCVACLKAGKHVVTANKALLAEHGDELFALAARHQVTIAFEAAVAGGIPIIAALRDGLVANRIEGIYAILNGTCN